MIIPSIKHVSKKHKLYILRINYQFILNVFTLLSTAGKGWNEYGTYIIVPDPVTWYAAANSSYEFGKYVVDRQNIIGHVGRYMIQNG